MQGKGAVQGEHLCHICGEQSSVKQIEISSLTFFCNGVVYTLEGFSRQNNGHVCVICIE